MSAAPASAASSVCSDLDDALAVGTPSSSGPCLLSASSIELATTGRQALEHGSVRSKAAYFEALCHANTTMHIQCSSEDGAQQCGRPSREPRISRQLQHGAFPDADMAHADSDEEAAGEWQDFSEVHLLLRMPRSHAAREQPTPSSSSKYGSIAEMEDLIERLQEALELKEGQHKAAVDAFRRRSAECENLQTVVRELSESRSKAACQRAVLAEKYGELQSEYHRMLRIADLSRTVSKENLATTSRTRSELRRVQSELHATKNHALSLNEKHKKVRVENALLKEKVGLLERCDFAETQESECKKHFTRYRLAETY